MRLFMWCFVLVLWTMCAGTILFVTGLALFWLRPGKLEDENWEEIAGEIEQDECSHMQGLSGSCARCEGT